MTVEEIIKNGRFIENTFNPEYSSLELDFYIEFFEEPVSILAENILNTETGPKVSLLKEILNELLNFDQKHKESLKEKIWNHYKICIANTSYGMVNYEGFENHIDANNAYFKISNAEESYKGLELKRIYIDLDPPQGRNFLIYYRCPWDAEHGISVAFNNGKMEMMC